MTSISQEQGGVPPGDAGFSATDGRQLLLEDDLKFKGKNFQEIQGAHVEE